jgi:putative aldouronate transport system substrate-binding protein
MISKKVMFKKMLVLLLALTFVVSTFGCGSTTQNGEVSASSTADAAAANSEGTASTAVSDAAKPVTLDLFYDFSWVPMDNFTGIIPEEITKKTGVTLNITKAVDSKQLGLMIASNDLPELIFTPYERNRLANPDLCYAWNELIDQYAPDFKPREVSINIAKSYSTDDNYYTILNLTTTNKEWAEAAIGAPGQSALYFRQDIYEALGSPKFETVDDYLNILAMVKEKYPDMIPLGMDAPFWFFQPFATWLGYQVNDFIKNDDGSVVFRTNHEKYPEYLKFVNNLYRKGYITVENYAIQNEADSLSQIAYSGKAFSYVWYTGDKPVVMTNATKENVPAAEWRPAGALNTEYKSVRTPTGWGGVYITKSCKNPEKAIKFMQFMLSDEGRALAIWGREGIDYTLDDKGVPVFSEEWLESRQDQVAHTKKFNPWFYFAKTEIDDVYANYSGMPDYVLKAADELKKQTVNMPELGLAVPNTESDEGIILTKLQELLKTEEAKIFFSKNDDEFLKNYNALMDATKKIGVDKLDSYMTNKVKEISAKYTFD